MPIPLGLTFEIALTEQLRFILSLGAAVGAALIGGAIAVRLGQPSVVGYVISGVVLGQLPGARVSDIAQIGMLADVGVILLLFALGVQFSVHELAAMRRVALGAGGLQVLGVLVIGSLAAAVLGFEPRAAFVAGAALSISSTIVIAKTLIGRGELDSLHGRSAIGWSIVQDMATIVFIVSLPPLAGGEVVAPLVAALVKAAVFLALAYLVGTRLLPWLFSTVARLGSSELFLLAVVGTALLTAFLSSAVFGLSLALGAFVAGLLLSESDLSYQAAAEVIPFRDLFAVLFFVSVGMLLDPAALAAQIPLVVVFVAVAVGVKGLLSAALGRVFGLPVRSALLVGATLAQIGEFSFILAEQARGLRLLDAAGYNGILGSAVASIIVSPLAVRLAAWAADRWEVRVDAGVQRAVGRAGAAKAPDGPIAADAGGPAAPSTISPRGAPWTRTERALIASQADRRHVVVLGVGRVGRLTIRAVRARGFGCVAVDRDRSRLDEAARLGAITVYGDAANPEILRRTDLERARVLVVAIGDRLTARLATERALRINPELMVAARARGPQEIGVLRSVGVRRIAEPEAEAAFELARHALQRMGVSGPELAAIVVGLRREAYGP